MTLIGKIVQVTEEEFSIFEKNSKPLGWAAKHGNLVILKWLKEKCCPLNGEPSRMQLKMEILRT